MTDREALAAEREWRFRGRIGQQPPRGPWRAWLVIGGRGSGKTRLGAEWVGAMALGLPPFTMAPVGHIALVGETLGDVREVMIEGPSGIMRVSRAARPRLEVTRRRLVWDATGAVASMFSSEDPESLRGPQFDAAWCDEFAKWKNLEETWDMLQFGLRLGDSPRALVTTTPRPLPLVRRMLADASVPVTRMKTGENAENLAPGFIEAIAERYGGTRLGRQELDGEMIEERPDALWSRALVEAVATTAHPPLARIVVAVDPPASATAKSDCCGIVAAGIDEDGRGWVIADESFGPARPHEWARRAVALFHRLEADRIVAEVNQGGDMVAAVIAGEDPDVPVRKVHANRGKWLRAEPVAALYERGRVRHAGRFPALEDEMCDFGHDGLSSGRSPDRMDALVWALSELMLGSGGTPRVRTVG